MNLLEADQLAWLSEEYKRYSIMDCSKEPAGKQGFNLRYRASDNETCTIVKGERQWYSRPDSWPTAQTEAEAWDNLPPELKAYRESLIRP